jgi:hypothetical protein
MLLMATKKKDFTSADSAIDKFFSSNQDEKPTNDAQHTHITNERGKRAERFGLLLDKQLKEDLFYLSKATGSKSINDFIIKILLEYVERTENQTKLKQYKKLLE